MTIFQNQTILLGDCVHRMAELAPASIDVVCTSPPYNIGTAYRSYDDRQPRSEYLTWLGTVSAAIGRVLKPDGSLFLNVGSTNRDPWLMHDIAEVFRREFQLQNHIIWVKSISIGDDTLGHFKPINSRRFLNHNHEAIFHFTHTGDVPVDRLAVGVEYKDKTNIARRGHAQDKRCAGNVWFMPYPTVQSQAGKFHHPAGFPVELAKRCIRLHGGGVILDPFMGTGATLLAALELGCSGFGIEIDAHYAARALARLEASGRFD